MKPDKNGELVCNVCSQHWHNHAAGGNCQVLVKRGHKPDSP